MKKLLLFTFIITTTFSFSQTQIGSDIDGEATGDVSGRSISLSSDGSIVAIGASGNSGSFPPGGAAGHVRVYKNELGNWVQLGLDIDGEATGDVSGRSISLSSDGSIVAIGANRNNDNGASSGHVRVYENISNNWVQVGSDIDGEAIADLSGHSVSLSSDGSIVAIGAIHNDGNGTNSGHVRVYKNESGNWVQVGSDINGEGVNDLSGYSVSLSSDGFIVAIGAIHNDGNGTNSGHVRVYKNESGNWVQVGSDINGEGANDLSGWSVSLSLDGSIVAIGAIHNDGNGDNSGHVRVYQNISGNWVQVGSDINGEGANDSSGYSVSLSSDGSIVAIGANRNNGNYSGHVRVYKNESGNWVQLGIDIDAEATGDELGWSVSLSSNASVVAIGGPSNDANGNYSGHVRVFDLSSVLSSNSFILHQFKIYPNPTKEEFTIQLEEGTQLKKVSIYNQLGQFISSTNTNLVNTKNLSQGMYFVEIETNQGKSREKLIIN